MKPSDTKAQALAAAALPRLFDFLDTLSRTGRVVAGSVALVLATAGAVLAYLYTAPVWVWGPLETLSLGAVALLFAAGRQAPPPPPAPPSGPTVMTTTIAICGMLLLTPACATMQTVRESPTARGAATLAYIRYSSRVERARAELEAKGQDTSALEAAQAALGLVRDWLHGDAPEDVAETALAELPTLLHAIEQASK